MKVADFAAVENPSGMAHGAGQATLPADGMHRLLSELASALERTGECRVLRRLHPRERYADLPQDGPTRIGLVVDTETTGLDTKIDEPIELAMVRFSYDESGRVGRILDTFSAFNQPSRPIP